MYKVIIKDSVNPTT